MASPNERRWTIYECPKCHRRGWSSLEIKPGHWWRGERCGGEVEQVEVMPVPSSQEDEGRFTFTTSSESPEARVRCNRCGWTTEGDLPREVFPRADRHECPSTQPVEDEVERVAWRYRVRRTTSWHYTEDSAKIERLRRAVDDDGGRLVNERIPTWEIEALAVLADGAEDG